jgi:hypothetical protein
MAHDHVGRPLGEGDFADEPGFDPVSVTGVLGRDRGVERAGGALQRAELAHQVSEHGLGEAGADMPDVP